MPKNKLDYTNIGVPLRHRVWRVLRLTLPVIIPLAIYVGIYAGFASRAYLWGGAVAFKYPGLIRFYALDSKGATSFGNSAEMIEKATDAGDTVRQFDESLLFVSKGWYHHLWRIFYPAERLELLVRGASPIRIAYSSPTVASTPTSSPKTAALPLVGAIYEDWFVRDNTLYRFIQGVSELRDSANNLNRRNDVYLFEWPLGGTWDSTPRNASRVRLVETNSRTKWSRHWMVDADHFITWNENTGDTDLLAYGTNGQPANVIASVKRLGPVRSNRLSSISVSPTAKYLAGEKDGLSIFRTDTLQAVRHVPEGNMLNQFFQARPDELDNNNSLCFLTDDGTTLVRLVEIYRKVGNDSNEIVSLDLTTGTVQDIPINLGIRADVHGVNLIDRQLWLYVIYTTKGGFSENWQQCILNPITGAKTETHPENRQHDMVPMEWDASGQLLVDLPGFEVNPQALEQDSEICIESVGGKQRSVGIIRYGDSTGYPNVFKPGMMKFAWP